MSLRQFLAFITPHFITEDVAVLIHPDWVELVCPVNRVRRGETFDGIVSARSLAWFNMALFATFDHTAIRPWLAPKQ